MHSSNWKVNFPPSNVAVDVSVIDTTTYLREVNGSLVVKPVYAGFEKGFIPSYSFLIHHKPSGQRLLYDLGLRTNWETHLSPHLREEIKPLGFKVEVKRDVAEIIGDGGLKPDQINAIILSHHHWDHVGDPTLFPSTTKLVVGPGYKQKYLPGWPAQPDASGTTTDTYKGRVTEELDFQFAPKACQIGPYPAYDWFSDGSFYLLNAPGHTTGHICGLARTSVGPEGDTFMFLGGDVTHHCALFRPTEYYPLPEEICPDPVEDHTSTASVSSEKYVKVHRAYQGGAGSQEARVSPFCLVPVGYVDEDADLAQETLNKMFVFDGDENVFTVFAHDPTLLDVLDFFPQKANEWKTKGWAKKSHWKFLGPLKTAG
ncbi:uncharacterized protein A1O5_10787 [Cladophialophora psammophila CBS 110553]|uniref:Metallo-beta-lactamase domain-containing protein n=1 Tax=Cladophialophora psammophila CBS 110553 TaxID=1182543 RepID=W9WNC7_9EURO|nr:uncharacterized protein A1O5_10787 [Cladophialophora psammophila CBS 110553]EXJ66171.1 hypothetical protein A1O5_10787 [Cladophialophora psammophila CBS 110553]